MTVDVAALRALLEQATSRPWKQDIGIYQDPDGEDDLSFARGPMVRRIRGESYDAHCERAQHDARLIAAAVNALPALLDVVEAAGPMRDGHEGCVTDPPCGACFRCDFDRAVDKLRSGQ